MKLSDFDHLRSDKRVKFKEETVDGVSLTIIAYMISDSHYWDIPLAEETRGSVFNTKTGVCVCRPFEKFFNVGEREDTQPNMVDYVYSEVFEKRDGSMIMPVLIHDQIHLKTKKSFFSEVALEAQSVMTPNIVNLCKQFIQNGFTPIFEYTSPNWQVVIDYGKTAKFTLLAARRIDDGLYLNYEDLSDVAESYGIPLINKYKLSKADILFNIANQTNFEGYVIFQCSGKRVKQKTNWYLINHRLMTELRERDVALAAVEETLDDIKSELALEGKDLTEILEIEDRVSSQIAGLISETEALVEKMKREYTRKNIAMKYRNDSVFALAIKLYEGKEPRYIEFWKRRYLDSYSLRCIYNKKFSNNNDEDK